ncbi:MAG: hypothetical protein V2I43_03960, partial [Parvularcula sp.]|nr:hypothetical protein [Parvularcula sp.]
YSWEAISPDLTRDDPEKQGPMGAPITNEVSENYNTIAYLAESPRTADILWAGSDDGLVHVTDDRGESWDDVTPDGLDESLINAIEPSPHDPETAYVVATRYKFGDREPYIYRTENLGRSWTRIDGDLPAEESLFARVVREDPEVEGLLYAGTETGLYVSWDDGDNWSPLQLNLPAVPVTDLKIHQNDLLVATQGRGFYVLDDLNVVRAGPPSKDSGETLTLYTPEPSIRRETGGGAGGGEAENPAADDGALIYYRLAEEIDLEETPLKLTIMDEDGTVLWEAEADQKTGPEGGKGKLPYETGLNRVTWNHRVMDAAGVEGFYHVGGDEDGVTGHHAGPGTYLVRMTIGEDEVEAPLEVRWDPRLETSDEEVLEQQKMLADLRSMIDELHRSITALTSAKEQAAQYKDVLEETDGDQDVIEAAEALTEAVDEWRDSVANFEREGFQDVLNFPDRLSTDLQFLYGDIDEATSGLTKGMRDRFADLRERWEDAMDERDDVIEGPIAAFDRALRDADVDRIVLPPLTEQEMMAAKTQRQSREESAGDE